MDTGQNRVLPAKKEKGKMIGKNSEIVFYTTDDGRVDLEIKLDHENETIWLTQLQMADLFDTSPQNITQHIKSVYDEQELAREATCKDFLQVQREGSRTVERSVTCYNLKTILAVGYRVRSKRGVQFRKWATEHLNEYLVKGFLMDDKRLKNPDGGWDRFDDLLERIRDIRASEKRFYQKVRDLFSQTSVDYDKRSEEARTFFASVQNKLIFAETGKTAAELIVKRAEGNKPNMGLTAFEGDRVRKRDIGIAKNYLSHEELTNLNRLVTMFLDFAEDRTKMRKEITMREWIKQTDKFLDFHDRNLLQNSGSRSRKQMEEHVMCEFEKFESNRKREELLSSEKEYVEDLEKAVKELEKKQ